MLRLTKFIREAARAPCYRSSPIAALRYAYAKWVFSRFRQKDPTMFLGAIGIDLGPALQGFDRWHPKLERVVSSVKQEKIGQGGISLADGLILQGLVRTLHPDIVVETGVAAGVSTSFFGAALIENKHGTLVSIELPPAENNSQVRPDGSRYLWQGRGMGWAIPSDIRTGLANRHRLILQDVRHALPDLLDQIPQIDIFFHDDLHTPDHMLWEYELVWPRLRPGGVLVSDDVNYAWIEFCRRSGASGSALENVDRLCALRKPGRSNEPTGGACPSGAVESER